MSSPLHVVHDGVITAGTELELLFPDPEAIQLNYLLEFTSGTTGLNLLRSNKTWIDPRLWNTLVDYDYTAPQSTQVNVLPGTNVKGSSSIVDLQAVKFSFSSVDVGDTIKFTVWWE